MKADLDSAHGDRVKHPSKDAPRLVTAQDIARERIAGMPADTFLDRLRRSQAFMQETQRAMREKERGEWRLP